MDIEAVRIFLKTAELASFTRAAKQLGVSKSQASLRVSALEEHLGARLLTRTTRAVRLTSDGEQFLERARRLVNEVDEASSMFQLPRNLRGKVRVDLPMTLAREVFIPRLPELLNVHPQLEVVLSTTDRLVDVVREGFDCVLRVGNLRDSGLFARRLGVISVQNYASPTYLLRHGTPQTLDDLARHFVVGYATDLADLSPSFEYFDGARYRELPMRSHITVNNADSYAAACAAGLGIIQAPNFRAEALTRVGLVEVLPQYRAKPMPVSILHAHGRSVPKRAGIVIDWIARVMAPRLSLA
jgi:DNA-binding transcriptional LysR family regulator